MSPKSMMLGSNRPLCVTKAAFHWWLSLMWTLLGARYKGVCPRSEENVHDVDYVELEGQETMWTRRSSQEMSAANGSTIAMETASRWSGNGAGRMAQQAARTATQNKFIQGH